MSRTWAELLGDGDDGAREDAERSGFFGRLRDSLGKSRRALQAELSGSFDASREEEWERLEVALIRADVGVPATAELVRRLEARGELVDLLRRYAGRAQFVVITHQKRTMEAADVLYGVTMGDDGVSQIVSRRLPREERAAATA